jgi:hypothetical protein
VGELTTKMNMLINCCARVDQHRPGDGSQDRRHGSAVEPFRVPSSEFQSLEELPSPVRVTEQMKCTGDDTKLEDTNTLHVEPNSIGDLNTVGPGDEPMEKISSAVDAIRVYYRLQRNLPAHLSTPLKSKITSKLVPWFSAAATPEELVLLQDRNAEAGKQTVVLEMLHTLLWQRLKAEFVANGQDKPSLKQGKI